MTSLANRITEKKKNDNHHKSLNNKTRNKTIMIQGTASNAGKSLLAAALCRIFKQDGFRVAPFKSWNMSLNSFVTPEGGEIGIAQAIQAEAAGVSPTVDMQPILVKPKGDGLSQVVVRGKPIGDMGYQQGSEEYIKWALDIIKGSLNRLKDKYEIVVLEGAGSPAEINVKKRDLANMKVAALNKTPVILVADIDRGGAFASLVGTLQLLEAEERELVKGFIINRFRGDVDILQPGIDFLEEYTGRPVLGVIPYLRDIILPEEDSVSLIKQEGRSTLQEEIKIGVIRLPHISNFTDFASLAGEPDVSLTYIEEAAELTELDLIIIPGTKSTTTDLEYLKKTGLAERIMELSRDGMPVMGICGGFQMMGRRLLDPHHTEGPIEEISGLGILPVETTFLPEKTTHQVKARVTGQGLLLSGLKDQIVEGYEIHMGESRYLSRSRSQAQSQTQSCLQSQSPSQPYFISPFRIYKRSGQRVDVRDGAVSESGLHFGTYIHGIFNNDHFRRSFLNRLRKIKGLSPEGSGFSYRQKLDADYDKLAEIVRENLRMGLIYDLLKIDEGDNR